jgi:hypothetical protein
MDVSICENGYDDRVFINCPFDDAYLPLEEWLIETSDRTDFPKNLPFWISQIP